MNITMKSLYKILMASAVMALPFLSSSCSDDDGVDFPDPYDMSSLDGETISVSYDNATLCHNVVKGGSVILLKAPNDWLYKQYLDYYKFLGWGLDPEAETPDYKPGDTIVPQKTMLLYPIFEPVEITKESAKFTFDIVDNVVTFQYIPGFPKADYCAWSFEDINDPDNIGEDEGAKVSFKMDLETKYKVTLYAEVEEENFVEVDTVVDLTNMLTPDFDVKLIETISGTDAKGNETFSDYIVVEQNVEGAETVIWNFGAKGSYTINKGDKDFNKFHHTYVKSGTYTITLTVVDKQGRKTTMQQKYETEF